VSDLPAELPGADLVEAGVADLQAGRLSEASLLVLIAAPRLRALGMDIPRDPDGGDSPEHRLYALLASSPRRDAYSYYNALLARVASFADAAEHAAAR